MTNEASSQDRPESPRTVLRLTPDEQKRWRIGDDYPKVPLRRIPRLATNETAEKD